MAVPNEGGTNLPSDAVGRYFLGGWDGAAFWAPRVDSNKRLITAAQLQDAGGVPISTFGDGDNQGPAAAIPVQGRLMRFNGTAWDRVYNNTQGTLLASAARTATTSCPLITNYNARGVMIFLNVTVASGTGGLTVLIAGVDTASGSALTLLQATAAVTTVTPKIYIVYPGAGAAAGFVAQVAPYPFPRTLDVVILAGDSSSYTYSVGYSLIQ